MTLPGPDVLLCGVALSYNKACILVRPDVIGAVQRTACAGVPAEGAANVDAAGGVAGTAAGRP